MDTSDEALFAAYRAGDTAAHEALFRRHEASLRRHLERMLDGDRAAAEDLVVETFLRLHRHRHRWRDGTPVRPWLYTIARNLARNRRRALRLWGWLPLTSVATTPAQPAPEATDEVQQRIAAAFAALPAAQREACSLRLLGDLSLHDIAQVTRAAPGTVKSRLHYGLRRLRAELADLAPEGFDDEAE
jgi:RNA polymerase sigma-70 factor (ECF subfamily)